MSPVEPVPGSSAPSVPPTRTVTTERRYEPADGTHGPTGGTAVRCLTCRTVIWSEHRHHMARCGCPDDSTAVWVDGGAHYTRMAAGPDARWEQATDDTAEGGQ